MPGRGCCHPRRWSFTLTTTKSSIRRMQSILPPFHPYRHSQDIVRCLEMLRRSVSVALSRGSLPSGCYPAPYSVECGLSSAAHQHSRDHPINQRYIHHTSFLFNRQLKSPHKSSYSTNLRIPNLRIPLFVFHCSYSKQFVLHSSYYTVRIPLFVFHWTNPHLSSKIVRRISY